MRTPRNIQSPKTATDFWNQLSSVNPRMALFMKVTPYITSNLTTIGLTSNTRDMTLPGHPGITFKSAAGMMPSNAMQSINDETTLEMTGIYSDDLFKRSEVVGGLWENATIEIFIASWEDTNLGELVIFKGFLGEVKDYGIFFTAEGRGLASKLSQNMGWVTQRTCRVKQFRDSQCGHTASTVVINSITYNITYQGVDILTAGTASTKSIIYVPDAYWTSQLVPLPVPPNKYFNNGKITCISGMNEGIQREISSSIDNTVDTKLVLKRPFPFDISNTDQFDLIAGCNRTIEDCQKYDNILNFRGEPFVPGLTQLLRVPRSDEWTVEQ